MKKKGWIYFISHVVGIGLFVYALMKILGFYEVQDIAMWRKVVGTLFFPIVLAPVLWMMAKNTKWNS